MQRDHAVRSVHVNGGTRQRCIRDAGNADDRGYT